MPTIKIKIDVHKLLRRTVFNLKEKRNLNREITGNNVIKEALELLTKKEKLE